MSVDELSASAQNYLKVIWGLSEWSDEPVTLKLIAQRAGVALSSASDAVRKLTEQGLLSHARYGSVELTEVGRSYALVMVRRHRLIETFLVETLGYRWDEVHEEAESLEHAVSDFMVERIDDVLGRPQRDPHGDPIPAADGTVTVPDARRLTDVGVEGRFVVERISDTDPAMLQFFESQGIGVGVTLVVAAGAPFSDALEVRSGEVGSPTLLGRSATDALYVSADPT
ncbi:metal-dependent transcriptional regulator [Brachybacterium paraconglomeratum]|uniref:metal-dependent transcriptional regulator n=1 Tax=Brachybacterium paraconglomeratum TaxID=173362 RepID=UPI0022E18117|nr:metal-dependent transcriptional regulator [Brachybacterium paraconglomeratum]